MTDYRLIIAAILLFSTMPVSAASVQTSKNSSANNPIFAVRFEQDGKIINARNHNAVLQKKPFNLIFDLDDTNANVQLNASFSSKTYRSLARKVPLQKLENIFGGGTGYAEERYTAESPPHVLHVEDGGSHYWFYQKLQKGEEHRYGSIKRVGDIIQARRIVQEISVFNGDDLFTRKNMVIPLEKMKQNILYLSIIYGTPNGEPNYDTHEVARQYVKVRFR